MCLKLLNVLQRNKFLLINFIALKRQKDLEPFSMFILMDKEVSLIPSSVGRFSSLMALFAA